MRILGRAVLASAFVAASCLVPLFSASAAHADTPDLIEHIVSYDVAMKIESNGLLDVRESIVYDFGVLEHHGIFQDILQRENWQPKNGYDRVYKIHVGSVTQDDSPVHVSTSTNGAYKEIKIGDPNKLVGGTHTYVINYTVSGALDAFPDHDELYWNAVGTQWQVPIDQVSVGVDAPWAITKVACYSGPQGSNAPCDRATSRDTTASFAQSNLDEEEGVSIVVALPKGVIEPPPQPILEKRWNLDDAFARRANTLTPAGILAVLGIGGVLLLAYRRGRDRRYKGSAVDAAMGNATGAEEPVAPFAERAGPVEFAPPQNIRPGEVGVLVDESANLLDVTATIVDLATRGYLKITELPAEGVIRKHHDYQLDRVKDADSALLPYEQKVLSSLFATGDSVTLSDLKYKFAPKIAQIRNELLDDSVTQGWFRIRPDRTRQRWHAFAFFLLIVSLFVTYFVARNTTFGLVALAGVLTALVLLAVARNMPARTGKGTAMLSRVRGFRQLFTDEDAVREHFAEQHNIFAQYLPYAIVFGVTHKWAQAFEGLGAQELGMTGWYAGSGDLSTWNAFAFASSMEHFGTQATGTLYASMPSSSGGSGFGGGGFSGGGGGGGGGGSW